MFKKKTDVLTTRPLSGKDVKALKRRVEVSFPDLIADDLDALFPAKVEVQLLKLKNRATAYTCNGPSPLFFDPEGRGDLLVPTCYALWRCPNILEKLFTYSEVSPKVLGGADLFLQGLIVPEGGLGYFSAGDHRVVCIPQNPHPFAVGIMEASSDDIARTGLKGKGLKLLHHYPDQLWAMGDKSVPNAGFTPGRIFPQEGPGSSDAGATAAETSLAGMSLSEDTQPQASNGHPEPAAGAASVPAAAEEADTAAAADASSAGTFSAPAGHPQTQDELIELCLLKGLQSVTDEELPMLTSDLYAKHMGVLGIKIIHKQDKLVSVNREHELYQAHTADASPAGASSSASPSAAAVRAEAAPSSSGRISVTFSYRAPSSLRPIFGPSAEADRDALYSEAQVHQALQNYQKQQQLSATGSCIKLDR
ncbi:hypothetical protein CVIRNUC_009547 [Coccomyxa viridis]|uniref:Eukaryotic translation initiation factor 2D n=1 Tax=Coccomyxa viridis TaxID=1274662 RepID=A0AAV1IK50_9CHLO|nr:hypothetical protein CVIRNUC_009547 [Coccomyxa viridis]